LHGCDLILVVVLERSVISKHFIRKIIFICKGGSTIGPRRAKITEEGF
jgi:hypothetical protein